MNLSLCLLQDPWCTYVDGESVLTVEALVIRTEQFTESHSVVLTAIGEAAEEAVNYSGIGSLVLIEAESTPEDWASRIAPVESEYREHLEMDADHKTLFAKSLKVFQLSEQIAA